MVPSLCRAIRSTAQWPLSTSCERAIAAAQSLSNSVNEMGFDYETFAQVLASDHRTLQQNSMRAFIAFCQELAKSYETDFYDGRNEASCKLAAEIVKLPVYLPSV